jgi:predicted DNA-binding protein with PD1-like motif
MTETVFNGLRIEAGNELKAAIEELAIKHSFAFCDISGFGELEWIELAGASENDVKYFEGPFQLIDLKGRIRIAASMVLLDLVCTVSRYTDNGIQVLGGKLMRARTIFTEVSFCALTIPNGTNTTRDSATMELVTPEKETKLVSDSSKPRPSVPPESPQSTSPDGRWAQAIVESEQVRRNSEKSAAEDELPRTGDIVNHRQFGRCLVIRLGDEHITLQKPDKRTVQLGIAILDFARAGKEGKQSVFQVSVKMNR